MSNNLSVKHHYLPQFYLRGFTDKSEQFFIYDKTTERLWKSNPGDSFFEKDRNSIIYPLDGSKRDFLERMYTLFDTEAAPLFKKIIDSTPDKPALELLEKLNLSLFISCLFWRLPSNDLFTEKTIDEVGFETESFHLTNKDGSPVDDKIKKDFLAYSGIRKAFRLMLPFIPFTDNAEFTRFVTNWKIYYSDPLHFNITGDNPLIYFNKPDYRNPLAEFIFPISGGRLLMDNPHPGKKQLSGEFTLDVGLITIDQSTRFVCAENGEFLRALVDDYNVFISAGQMSIVYDRVRNAILP